VADRGTRFVERLKHFYKFWLEPEGVRRWRGARGEDHTLQKFWLGSPVPTPPMEAAFFRAAGLESVTLTRQDDSRPCGKVQDNVRLPLTQVQAGDVVQIGVAVDRWLPSSSVRVCAGARSVRHVGLAEGQWLDIRLDLTGEESVLELHTDQPLWVSVPRIVRSRVGEPPVSPRHFLVIALDGWCRLLDYDEHPTIPGRRLTPNIDRAFAEGCHGPLGFSSAEWTLPTTASFFTGLYPSRHRMVHPQLPSQQPTNRKLLAEYFQEQGYHTLALSCGNRLTPAFGSHRGFDRFIYHWAFKGRTELDYHPAVWISEVLGHLDAHREDRTFTYVHFPDTHPPWSIGPMTRSFNLGRRENSAGHDLKRLEHMTEAATQGAQLMKLRLHELDRLLGGLFEYIDGHIADDTVIVLTADHGTPWPFDGQTSEDGLSLNRFRTATSISIRGRSVEHRRHHGPVSPNLDLMPTLLTLAGITPPDDLDGRDLLLDQQDRPFVVSESLYGTVYEIAVCDADRKWVERFPMDEVSNLLTGPAFYRRGFSDGRDGGGTTVTQEDPEFEGVVRDHIRRVGLEA
jgi:arylsulfatase A-like enzyme